MRPITAHAFEALVQFVTTTCRDAARRLGSKDLTEVQRTGLAWSIAQQAATTLADELQSSAEGREFWRVSRERAGG